MNKRNIINIVVFLVLGIITTYIATIIEIFASGNILSGASGIPFRYGFSSFFGGSEINQFMFLLDVIFWTLILFGTWKVIVKVFKR